MSDTILNMTPGRKLAEIWIDPAGNPKLAVGRDVKIMELEGALGNLFFAVLEKRIRAQVVAENKTPIVNPYTGRNFVKARMEEKN